MFNLLRKLFGRSDKFPREAGPGLDPEMFVYVMIPGDIQPLMRGERFEDPLIEVLESFSVGSISGGGSQLGEPYPDGRPRVDFCGIDVDVTDRDRALGLIREKLVELNTPCGTEVHYTVGNAKLLDRFVEGRWQEGLPRSFKHPGFGV